MAIDMRREQRHIWREYDLYQDKVGEEVIWFKFDTDDSVYDDIYDEGGKSYRAGIHMPVMWVDQIEDPEQYSGEGRRPTQRLRFAVSGDVLSSRGISTYEAHGAEIGALRPAGPVTPQPGRPGSPWLDDRLNDVVFYDNRFYTISNFQIRGRLQTQDLVIGVSALEMIPEDESVFDFFPLGNRVMDVPSDGSAVESLDIWVKYGNPNHITIDFDVPLNGSWSAYAESAVGRKKIPVEVVNTDSLKLNLSQFTSGFPWQWTLQQETPSGQILTVYRGFIKEVVEVVDDYDDTEWLNIYVRPELGDTVLELEFKDPETGEFLHLEGVWDAYVDLPTGVWGIPVDYSHQEDGTISIDLTAHLTHLPADWWLIQTSATGQSFKVYEGIIYEVEQE